MCAFGNNVDKLSLSTIMYSMQQAYIKIFSWWSDCQQDREMMFGCEIASEIKMRVTNIQRMYIAKKIHVAYCEPVHYPVV